jgi:hypothetical protein
MSTDCTSFIINYQCERQGGGTYFDGLFGTNITINFSETPMFKGQNDAYFLPELDNPTLHPPSPLICFINEALIYWDKKDGMKYKGEATELEGIVTQVQTQ